VAGKKAAMAGQAALRVASAGAKRARGAAEAAHAAAGVTAASAAAGATAGREARLVVSAAWRGAKGAGEGSVGPAAGGWVAETAAKAAVPAAARTGSRSAA